MSAKLIKKDYNKLIKKDYNKFIKKDYNILYGQEDTKTNLILSGIDKKNSQLTYQDTLERFETEKEQYLSKIDEWKKYTGDVLDLHLKQHLEKYSWWQRLWHPKLRKKNLKVPLAIERIKNHIDILENIVLKKEIIGNGFKKVFEQNEKLKENLKKRNQLQIDIQNYRAEFKQYKRWKEHAQKLVDLIENQGDTNQIYSHLSFLEEVSKESKALLESKETRSRLANLYECLIVKNEAEYLFSQADIEIKVDEFKSVCEIIEDINRKRELMIKLYMKGHIKLKKLENQTNIVEQLLSSNLSISDLTYVIEDNPERMEKVLKIKEDSDEIFEILKLNAESALEISDLLEKSMSDIDQDLNGDLENNKDWTKKLNKLIAENESSIEFNKKEIKEKEKELEKELCF